MKALFIGEYKDGDVIDLPEGMHYYNFPIPDNPINLIKSDPQYVWQEKLEAYKQLGMEGIKIIDKVQEKRMIGGIERFVYRKVNVVVGNFCVPVAFFIPNDIEEKREYEYVMSNLILKAFKK